MRRDCTRSGTVLPGLRFFLCPEELISLSLAQGRVFAPGENWAYSHSDYVNLGLALELITGTPLDVLLRELVLDPLGLVNTISFDTPEIPEPVLHAFTTERRATPGISAGTSFYVESTSGPCRGPSLGGQFRRPTLPT